MNKDFKNLPQKKLSMVKPIENGCSPPSTAPIVDLSNESPKDLPPLLVRFSEKECKRKFIREPDTLTEAETRLGRLGFMDISPIFDISREAKDLRNTPGSELPPDMVRWTPSTLKFKFYENREFLTKMEIKISLEIVAGLRQRGREKIKMSAPASRYKIGERVIEITQELRNLRKVNPNLLPQDIVRYSPKTCRVYLKQGKGVKMTKAERDIGEMSVYHCTQKNPRSYSVAGKVIKIGHEELLLRRKKLSEIPSTSIRYSPSYIVGRIYSGKSHLLTKEERRIGILALKEKNDKIHPENRLMRRIPVDKVPPDMIRYSPQTLARKVNHKDTKNLTLGEIEAGKEQYKKNCARYRAKKKAERLAKQEKSNQGSKKTPKQ